MKKLSEIWKTNRETANRTNEAFIPEGPSREEPPKSERRMQIESFAHNKSKREEVIKAWTKLSEHPVAKDMNAEIGSAFDEADLDEDMGSAYDAIGEGGMIYASFEDTFWIRHKGKLIRVM